MPTASTIAHRLYLTAFWGLLALGILVPAVSLVIQVHDPQKVVRAARCLKDKLAAIDAKQKC